MRRSTGFLMLALAALLAGCGRMDDPARGSTNAGGGGGDETRGPITSSCDTDGDCNRGMVCEACPDGVRSCVPGCRTTAQCGPNLVCLPGVVCLTCPCPPGWCELDPCRDLDKDGWAFTNDPNIACPGKNKGDCNDASPRVHPGAREYCADWVDNDCDGNTDARDSDCQQCSNIADRCNSPADCGSGGGRTCDRGCCAACPTLAIPDCGGACVLPGGLDPVTGCALPSVCGACASCSTLYRPVCGVNYATYNNECYAAGAGVEVLHTGACLAGEGLSCNDARPGSVDSCAQGTWCRDLCLAAPCLTQDQRCTRVGTCSADADCPAGIGATPICSDHSVAPLRCESHRCVAKCP